MFEMAHGALSRVYSEIGKGLPRHAASPRHTSTHVCKGGALFSSDSLAQLIWSLDSQSRAAGAGKISV